MLPEDVAEIPLDRCPDCRGLWFDPAELERYVQSRGRRGRGQFRDIRMLPEAGKLACPRCATPSLDAFRAGAVFVSRCRRCRGVYLSGADLRALDGPALRLLPEYSSELHDRPVETTVKVALGVAAEVFFTALPF